MRYFSSPYSLSFLCSVLRLMSSRLDASPPIGQWTAFGLLRKIGLLLFVRHAANFFVNAQLRTTFELDAIKCFFNLRRHIAPL